MFEVFVHYVDSVEFGRYKTCGIRSKSGNEFIEYRDVSLSIERAEAFVTKLNEMNTSPTHLFDIIQDNLGICL